MPTPNLDPQQQPYLRLANDAAITPEAIEQTRIYNGRTLLLIEAINRDLSGEAPFKKYQYWGELLSTLEALYFNMPPDNAAFFASMKALVEKSGLPKARIKNYLLTLQKIGMLEISGSGGRVLYQLNHSRQMLIEAGIRVEAFETSTQSP
ncbi:hypothetical protein Mmc1_1914 [Magnetococcus marinus MC-1]|uniref:Uncharacterized protein n=1 Tax=Magnetococcus marinus (strain ATCC BAA-1437 / JCM 17883 / MC-1) TaxID=156889 RepID=A0L8X9_MAGMM|nr:hypothetical protein [Magnetococcus marinus]ABK44422.1 hypothetical protein Mmc1_1914 [Magnetococcus marinus MC-1]